MNKRAFVLKFQRQANNIAAHLGSPVWLVGGALRDKDPRDFDVRILIYSFEDWDRLFKNEFSVLYENLKWSRKLSGAYGVNIDYQIQKEEDVRCIYRNKPRLRLDVLPDWVFAAGLAFPEYGYSLKHDRQIKASLR